MKAPDGETFGEDDNALLSEPPAVFGHPKVVSTTLIWNYEMLSGKIDSNSWRKRPLVPLP